MMNNKGQVLVLFLLLLPVFILVLALVIDVSLMSYNKNKLDNINMDILNSLSNKTDLTNKDIKMLLDLNDEDVVIDEITIDNKYIILSDHKKINPIFGRIIGFKEYTVKSTKKVKYISNLSLYFEIVNNKVNSLDGRRYNIKDNKIVLDEFNLKDKTLEVTFTNTNNELFVLGNNIFTISNNYLYINGISLGELVNNNIIDLIGEEKIKIYLNNKYITEIDNLNGSFTLTVLNIDYVKIYNELLNNDRISKNYNNYRSWLDEG